jgi:hypothetical protein
VVRKFFIYLSILSLSLCLFSENHIKIDSEKILEIGKGDLILERVYAISEDSKGNIFIFDGKAFKVHKFSPDGNLLLSFGQKGEGPGDFRWGSHMDVTEKDEIVVTESRNFISYFDNNGKFIKKYNFWELGDLLGLRYAGRDLFYARKEKGENIWNQVILNLAPKIVNDSISPPQPFLVYKENSGIIVIRSKDYTPRLYFSHYKKLSAAAVAGEYKIRILNTKGEVIRSISRDLDRQKMTSHEREYIEKKYKSNHIDPASIKGLMRLIPDYKNFIREIKISDKYLFVTRVKENIALMVDYQAIDIFSLDGKFIGNTSLKSIPSYVTDQFMYFVETDEEDNIIVAKYRYELSVN